MVKRHKVKITVLKRLKPSHVFEKSPVTPINPLGACELFEDEQVFVIDENMMMPEDFCSSAWDSIVCDIKILSFGGNFPWYKEKGVAISCCTDGLRPVIFKLERV